MVAVESLEGRLMASGVLVAPHYVVTNDHVVRGKHRVMIEHSDGSKTEGVVVWTGIAGGVDAAVVRINERAPVKPAKLRCSLPEVGEPVRVVGNPGAAENLMEARRRLRGRCFRADKHDAFALGNGRHREPGQQRRPGV